MKIGIDCRLWNESGVGRYIRNLVITLGALDTKNEYALFLLSKDINDKRIPARFKKVPADIHWHTLKEQFVMPKVFLKENLDILHIPYINIPLFYPKKLVVTIHDLTPIKYPTPKASKLPFLIYGLKLLFYYLILFFGVRKAVKVVAVSETTKKDIIKTFKIKSQKVVVSYNFNLDFKFLPPAKHRENYILYVGNAFPHKNLPFLIKAYETFVSNCSQRGILAPDLILVGKEDFFYKRLKDSVSEKLKQKIIFAGFSKGYELEKLYRKAVFVVQPSLYEGFGFQLVEASFAGTLVLCSDIPIFRELAKDSVVYFNPRDIVDLAEKLFLAVTMFDEDKGKYIEKSQERFSGLNAKDEVKKVLEIYENSSI
ncbi:glycosyltransferase family 4 protein [Patescibacteria group bacterium]|nr:glycosyltransferase family 4 protein [Patescibacteria group bacterium]